MEAWLAELEMEMNIDSNPVAEQSQAVSHCVEATPFEEQLAATLGDNFPYPLSSESNTSSPLAALDYFDFTHFVEPFTPTHGNNNDNNNSNDDNNNNNNNNNDNVGSIRADDEGGERRQQPQEAMFTAKGGKKRKREPSQVMDHIIAERKRRELLSSLFISLSAIVPGLKKTDKTSVLGEAIKYMKQLQEKVKVLEEVEAKRTVESVVVVLKKSQLVLDVEAVDDNGSSCTVDDNATGGGSGSGSGGGGGSGSGSGGGGGGSNKSNESLPEIEVKASDKTLLFRVYCEKQRAVLGKLLGEIEKHDGMSIISCNIIHFGSLGCDITIVVKKDEEFDLDVKDLVRRLRSAFQLA